MPELTTIGFDADDTLWHHERFYQLTQQRFAELLREHADPHHLAEHLLAAERRNVGHYGFGVKGFTLSMIETAIEISGGRIGAADIGTIPDLGKAMMDHPVELIDGVVETLDALAPEAKAGRLRLIVITKGDLFHQESKVARSGLAERFESIEIVAEKDEATYRRILQRGGTAPERFLMIGNSMKSDILPVLDIQTRKPVGYAIYKLISREPAGQRELSDPHVQQAIRQQLHEGRSQLLNAAYFEMLRDQAKVENFYAEQIFKNETH